MLSANKYEVSACAIAQIDEFACYPQFYIYADTKRDSAVSLISPILDRR